MTDDTTTPLSRNNRGPRSRKGKASAALARLDHGFARNEIVLPTEDPAEWARFHDDVVTRLEPEGVVELALASRVAETVWRLRRVPRAEQQSVDVLQVHRTTLLVDREHLAEHARRQREANGEPDPQPSDFDELMRRRARFQAKFGIYTASVLADEKSSSHLETLPVLIPGDSTLETLMRYGAHLNRVLKHTLHELEALQDRRHGNATPLARLDIN